jgi:tetratricopeptide (TPR) repeat protein
MKSIIHILFVFAVSFYGCKTAKTSVEVKTNGNKGGISEKEQLDFDYLFFEAQKDKILGNYAQALAKFNQALRIIPRNAATHYELSQLYLNSSNLELAEIHGQQAVKADPSNLWYKNTLATIYERLGKNLQLLKLMEEMAASDPKSYETQFYYARALVVAQKFDDAIKVFDKMERQFGIDEEVIEFKKLCYLKLNKADKAIQELKKLIAAYPEEFTYRGVLAELYDELGRKEDALKEYEAIVSLNPENPTVYFSLAEFYRQAGDKEKSFDALKKAFSNDEADINLKEQVLGSYLLLVESFPELMPQAMELCRLMISAHAESAKAYAIMGQFYLLNEQPDAAIEAFEKARSLDKSIYGAWTQLLGLLAERNQYAKMQQLCTEAIELFPTSPVFYFYNGMACMQLNQFEQAIEYLQGGLAITVDNTQLSAQFYSTLGDTYHKTGQHDLSDTAYEEALKLDADNVYVMNNYAYYLSLRKQNLSRALQLSSKSNDLSPMNASFLDTKAWIYFQMADFNNANTYIEKALEAGGSKSATITEHKGDILWKLGKTSEAIEFWKKAELLGEGSPKLKDKLSLQKWVE